MRTRLLLSLLLYFVVGAAHAFMPQTGTWVIGSELNGKPGRGIVLDAQSGVLSITIFAYERSGQPTFYLAAGPLVDNRISARLNRYEGGRFFGSGARSGVDSPSPGDVKLRFTSGITGFVQFPGEPELAISRFNFAYPFEASSLKGIWSITLIGQGAIAGGAFELSRAVAATADGNGLMTTADGTVGCEHQVRGNLAGTVLCAELDSRGQLRRGYNFVYSINEGEGISVTASGAAEGSVFLRRLMTAQGVGTGIIFKSAADEKALDNALRNSIRLLASQAAFR